MCTELLPVDQDGDICENISAAQPVQVEQDVAGVTRELYAAVRCASHLLKFCRGKGDTRLSRRSSVTLSSSCRLATVQPPCQAEVKGTFSLIGLNIFKDPLKVSAPPEGGAIY